MPTRDRRADVFVLDLGDTENRFSSDWLTAVEAALDEVERAEGPRALVTTATGACPRPTSASRSPGGCPPSFQARLAPQTAHEATTTGRRYGRSDAGCRRRRPRRRRAGPAPDRCGAGRVADGKAGDTLGTIKVRMYAPALATLRDRTDPRN